MVAAASIQAQTVLPPADLRAWVNGNDVELSWSPVANSDGYRLYYGSRSGTYAPGVNLGSATARTFADLPVGSYFVTLTAWKGAVESARSAELAVQITSPLSKPVNFSVVPSGNAVQLGWGAVRGADSYTLWYGYASGSYSGKLALGNVSGQAFSNLPNGKYFLRLGATAGNTSGPLSDEISVQLPAVNNTPLSISALNSVSVSPFGLLTITGTGFSPATSAISVLFTNKSDGSTVSVPAVFASATSVDVVVPPLIDTTSRRIVSGAVTVSVVQFNSTQQLSNALGGLTIAAMPSPASSLPTGLYSRIVIAAGIDSLEAAKAKAIQTADASTYLAKIDAAINALNSLSSQISQVMTSGNEVQLLTQSGTSVAFGRNDLAYLDQVLFAWITSLQSALAISGSSSLQALQTAEAADSEVYPNLYSTGSNCINAGQEPGGGDFSVLEQPCLVQQELARRARQILADMPKYAKVAYGGILTISSGAISGGISTLVGAGLALRVGIGVVTSWAMDLAGGSAPTLQGSVESALTGTVDEVIGVSVAGPLQPLTDLWRINRSMPRAPVATGSEPAAGIVVNKVGASVGAGEVALSWFKPTGSQLSQLTQVQQVISVPTVLDPIPGIDVSLSILSSTCAITRPSPNSPDLRGVTFTLKGSATGPVDTGLDIGTTSGGSCSAWTDCWREIGEPATTSWTLVLPEVTYINIPGLQPLTVSAYALQTNAMPKQVATATLRLSCVAN